MTRVDLGVLGSDGTLGGPGGSSLSSSVVSVGSATKNTSPVADGSGGYSFRRRMPQFQVLDYGIDTNGNDVNSGPWANLLSDIAAQANPRGAHVVFPDGDICLNNLSLGATQLTKNGRLVIEGQGDATRIFPGGSQGKALVLNGKGASNLLVIEVKGLKLGYGSDLTNPDLAYTQPLLTLVNGQKFTLEGITGYMSGTGKLILLDSIYNGTARDCYLATNNYAIPLEWNLNTNPQKSDTLSFRDMLLLGQYGVVMNGGGSNFVETIELDEYKYVTGTGSVNYAESFLASGASAGATSITLNTGDGALFSAGDSIAIAQSSGASTDGFEVNKILSISTDTLTLAQPLTWTHTTANRAQVIRGGVGFATPGSSAHVVHVHDSHLEHGTIGVFAWGGQQINFDNNMNTCLRMVRPIGTTDVSIEKTECAGASIQAGGSANILVDVPSWATGTNAPTRIMIDGPITNPGGSPVQLTVNLQGTSYSMDEFGYIAPTLGTGFAQGTYNPFGVKLGRDGLRFRGRLDMAAAVASGAAVFTLPTLMVPVKSSLMGAWQTNSQSLTATPVLNTLRVRGSDQANPGEVDMEIASTAAGYLSLDSVPPISVH